MGAGAPDRRRPLRSPGPFGTAAGVAAGLAMAMAVTACGADGAPGADAAPPEAAVAEAADSVAPGVRPDRVDNELTRGDTLPGRPSWTREDLEVLESTVAWARGQGLDRLPVGERVARLGERFVGAPYLPQTLDPPGPERLVVNLRAFDCVTFVESMLTLARIVALPRETVEDRGALMDAYSDVLTSVRYRGGRIAGYPSRLHYFSEWIADAEAKGFVEDVTTRLGGVPDPEPPTFMTAHREAYGQLEDPTTFEAIAEVEARLAEAPRHVVREERVADVEDRIRTGDVIAATSTLPGLDVAHTGIALRRDGVLRLMHAPLVGEAVQVSESSLAERLLRLSAQDGIMVARPVPMTEAEPSIGREP